MFFYHPDSVCCSSLLLLPYFLLSNSPFLSTIFWGCRAFGVGGCFYSVELKVQETCIAQERKKMGLVLTTKPLTVVKSLRLEDVGQDGPRKSHNRTEKSVFDRYQTQSRRSMKMISSFTPHSSQPPHTKQPPIPSGLRTSRHRPLPPMLLSKMAAHIDCITTLTAFSLHQPPLCYPLWIVTVYPSDSLSPWKRWTDVYADSRINERFDEKLNDIPRRDQIRGG